MFSLFRVVCLDFCGLMVSFDLMFWVFGRCFLDLRFAGFCYFVCGGFDCFVTADCELLCFVAPWCACLGLVVFCVFGVSWF